MKARDLLAEFDYVLKSEQQLIKDGKLPEAEATKFVLCGLSYAAQKQLEKEAAAGKVRMPFKRGEKDLPDEGMVEMDMKANSLEVQLLTLCWGLVRIENFDGADEYPGKDANTDKKRGWIIQWLPPEVRRELTNVLTEGASMSEDETKNL